jgi:hypothetical protein
MVTKNGNRIAAIASFREASLVGAGACVRRVHAQTFSLGVPLHMDRVYAVMFAVLSALALLVWLMAVPVTGRCGRAATWEWCGRL